MKNLVQYKSTLMNQLKKQTKKSLIDNVSKRLLELEFKSNPLNKIKVFQLCCQENTTYLIKMVEYDKYRFKSKEKPKYIKKETSYFVGFKVL